MEGGVLRTDCPDNQGQLIYELNAIEGTALSTVTVSVRIEERNWLDANGPEVGMVYTSVINGEQYSFGHARRLMNNHIASLVYRGAIRGQVSGMFQFPRGMAGVYYRYDLTIAPNQATFMLRNDAGTVLDTLTLNNNVFAGNGKIGIFLPRGQLAN